MLGATLDLLHLVWVPRVSILSQLRCWEQLLLQLGEEKHYEFQSSPSLGAGSNGYPADTVRQIIAVSILSQLRCWEQLAGVRKTVDASEVSILSQLRCWEQRAHVEEEKQDQQFR